MSMVRTVFTSEKFVGDVVSRLMKRYDRILVERDKADQLCWRVVARCLSGGPEESDSWGTDFVVATSLSDPPPNCS